jgi:acyl carrier protein
MNEFCEKVADILDTKSVRETDEFADFQEWDSLSVLSVIAMLDSNYGVNLTATDLKGVKTVGGLWQLVQAKR